MTRAERIARLMVLARARARAAIAAGDRDAAAYLTIEARHYARVLAEG